MHLARRTLAAALLVVVAACSGGGTTLDDALAAHADGNVEEAARKYREVLVDEPGNKYAHYNLGLIDQNAGDTQGAIASYRQALETDPAFSPALFNLAVALTESAPAEAISLYRKVIEIKPDDANAHLNLGFLLKDSGKEKEGEAELDKAVELDASLEERIPPSPTPAPRAEPD